MKITIKKIRNWFRNKNYLKRHLFICVNGCGDSKLNEMKPARDPEDPTIVCPKCGRCMWYIVPPKNRVD
jgi:hypothetical protein